VTLFYFLLNKNLFPVPKMKTSTSSTLRRNLNIAAGFTLGEMLVLLGIIAILVALLIPKIFHAIVESQVSKTVEIIKIMQSSPDSLDFAKDDIYNGKSYLDQPFSPCKFGEGRLLVVPACPTNAIPTADNSIFDLGGGRKSFGDRVIMFRVAVKEDIAKLLNGKMDDPGVLLGPDLSGQVKYTTPTNGVTLVSIYVAHK
jgi:competence protein ComGC